MFAVHLLKSLLETILREKWISARYTSLGKASVCLKTAVLDSAGMMMWLKRVQDFMTCTEPPSASLQYWGKCFNWAKHVSLLLFFFLFCLHLDRLQLFIVSFCSGYLMTIHFGVQGSEASCHRRLLSPVTGVLAESQHSDQPSCFFCLKSQVWIM